MLSFSDDLASSLNELLEVHVDAAEACEAAARRAREVDAVEHAEQLRREHVAEIALLRERILDLGGEPASHGDARAMLMQARVLVAVLLGDAALDRALLRNEALVVRAHEGVLRRPHVPLDIVAFVSGLRVRADDRLSRVRVRIESREARDRMPLPRRAALRSPRSA